MASPSTVTLMLAMALTGVHASFACAMGQAPPAVAAKAVVTGAVAAQVCVTPSATDLRALQDDRQRAVIVLHAFEPPWPSSGRLVASLLAGTPPTPREITRFAVHPLQAFTAEQPQRSQRFTLSLAGYAHLLQAGRPVCLQIGFDAGAHPGEGGRAEVSIELSPA
ncbi:hypothetical protein [Acidovorax sp. SUPP3334]|uniref:hypothetical protein n=1 Tax=Acidovorax sp. SUPP3334 TaxID=2920881 RepID=UPI0023DE583E|nr:hypothetical protein [Acidovorax sp. SUPP3334]GKT26994.1 hypothetical protein AVHM3334_22580 [Acidovorax sp. SUPP3334]